MFRNLAATALLLTAVAAQNSTSAPSWQSEKWDVIVVGSGPAGIIVADRMSEAGKKTLLLEGEYRNLALLLVFGIQVPLINFPHEFATTLEVFAPALF
jgi:NADPH-dependent 2,4-dienoyl-CoA reductase/sulfur reductase-like enzyme